MQILCTNIQTSLGRRETFVVFFLLILNSGFQYPHNKKNDHKIMPSNLKMQEANSEILSWKELGKRWWMHKDRTLVQLKQINWQKDNQYLQHWDYVIHGSLNLSHSRKTSTAKETKHNLIKWPLKCVSLQWQSITNAVMLLFILKSQVFHVGHFYLSLQNRNRVGAMTVGEEMGVDRWVSIMTCWWPCNSGTMIHYSLFHKTTCCIYIYT